MSAPRSIRPDFSAIDIPMDQWSLPFWEAAADHQLLMPRCTRCATFRWPAGPFCPQCRSQRVDWVEPGQARLYSFTVMPVADANKEAPLKHRIAALLEFDNAPGVRLVSVLVDAPIDAPQIGNAVEVDWIAAANTSVPAFRLRDDADIEEAQ